MSTQAETHTANIINYTDYHANGYWGKCSWSPLNWFGKHYYAPATEAEVQARAQNSDFYSLTDSDSTIIVANLSDAIRDFTWVGGGPEKGSTFTIGSDNDDLLGGGIGNDYLEGGAGNDTFIDFGGYNFIHGGEGYDTFNLQRPLGPNDVAWDGTTLYIRDPEGGLTLTQGVENICSMENAYGLIRTPKEFLVTDDGLLSGNKLTAYADSVTGDEGANQLTAQKAGSWLFGMEGDDTLTGAAEGNTTFVGGEGNDTLYSQGDNNTILFTGDFGQDTLYGFNDSDSLVFMGVPGATHGDFEDFLTFEGDNAIFSFGENSVTLVGVDQSVFEDAHIVLA